MKSSHILLSVILFSIGLANSYAQKMIIFNTYEDYTNQKGEEYDEFKHTMTVGSNMFLLVKKGKEKTKIPCKEIWGFTYGDALFRIDQEIFYPACLIRKGQLFYWENGMAHLFMIRDNKKSAYTTKGYDCYFSKDLNTKLVGLSSLSDLNHDIHNSYHQFKKENPEHKDLFDCIEEFVHIDLIRKCVNSYFE